MTVSYSTTPAMNGTYILYCNTTGFPPPAVIWQDSTGTTITTSQFNSSLSQDIFPVGSLYVEVETNFVPEEFTCEAVTVYNDMNWTANGSVFLNAGM